MNLLLNGKTGRTLEAPKSLFLSEYESKVYFTLLVLGESKPIEIVRASGVPQSKIYGILEGLEAKRLAVRTQPNPLKVKPVSLGIAVENFKSERIVEVRKAMSSGKFLSDVMKSLEKFSEEYRGKFAVFEPSSRREVRK